MGPILSFYYEESLVHTYHQIWIQFYLNRINVCKKPEESDILPYPALSGIQNSEPEEPDHEMGQTRPALTRNSDISGILG